jgi:hypothetical protein
MRSIIAVLLLCGLAYADEKSVARDHYLKGTKDYDLGLYEESVREYMAAYQAVDDPSLLYDIAQAYRLWGKKGDALRFYKSYLRKMPRAANRAEIEQKVAELERAIDVERRTQTGLPPDHVLKPDEARRAADKAAEDRARTDGREASDAAPVSAASSSAAPGSAASSAARASFAATESDAASPSAPGSSAGAAGAAAAPRSPALELKRARVEVRAGLATGATGLVFTAVGAAMLGLAIDTASQLERKYDPALDSQNTSYRALAGVFLSVGVAATTAGFVVYAIGRRTAHRARAQIAGGAPALRVEF